MATILFQAAGAALGGVFGPVGAVIGRAAGALAGNLVDRALLGGGKTISGARLATARIPGASEGTAINRVYGTARIGCTLIWATRFEEEVTVERRGGKATGTRVQNFRYYANLAVGLCEGPVAGIRRVWADGRELDLTTVEMRFYPGSDGQLPDPLIEAKQGVGGAPAYRGLAYVVFERLLLDDFGNRIPVLQFEVMRTVGALECRVRAMIVIPGATEHGYAVTPVRETTGAGSARIMNRNTLAGPTDWSVSIDELQALCPNLESVGLVVAWFGTDLRAGHCRIVPGVEVASRNGESRAWTVSGISRAAAHLVSQHDGGQAYGGTPDDVSVVEAIADLKARGLKVFLYPFVLMDIPDGNGLPDPYGGTGQAAYPWRGRITCFPAPGKPGTVDGQTAARTQVEGFCGTADAGDFSVSGTTVSYAGSDEGYRRMVLHYALLAEAAGGVDGFLIGSELRGLTTLRDGSDDFPFVEQLATLAADVRSILGPAAKLTYGADWSEYFGYHPADGSGDVFFHLDPLWASAAIDAVGIDNYMPLSDWRDEDLVEASPDGFRAADDPQALRAQITAGEGFSWHYTTAADRTNRVRSPITDGLAGKPWVFRFKDLEGWWSNPHYERVGGVEKPAPTAWIAGSKPIWFTELGCPAVDRGGNQPNVFPDQKSAESAVPYFSAQGRSDSAQRRFLEAHLGWWQSGAAPAGMVDPAHVFLWSWDARPYPAFPFNRSLWSDGANWRTGHWLNARLGAGTLAETVAAILRDHGFNAFDVAQLSGDLTGYVQGTVTSARALIEPLADVFAIDVIEDGGVLMFRSRDRASLPAAEISVLADLDGEPLWRETRGHDGDYAAEAIVSFFDEAGDYAEASVRSRRVNAATSRVLAHDLAAVMPEETALRAAENLLRDHRLSRHQLELALSPGRIDLQPGDVLRLADGPGGRFIATRIEDGEARRLHLRRIANGPQVAVQVSDDGRSTDDRAANAFSPVLHFLDLPRFEAGNDRDFARAAGFARPWRRIALSASAGLSGYAFRTLLERPATLGTLADDLAAGVSGRFDRAHAVVVDLAFGGLSSVSELDALNGANRLAVQALNGAWEVLSFAEAEEIAAGRWRLTSLLRGLGGSEDACAAGAASGAPVILLDAATVPLGLTTEEAGLPLNWIAEPAGGVAPSVGPVVFAGGTRAATPLAPVHLRAQRLDTGDIRLSWVRRGRIDADGWQASEIPLGEDEERYRLEIVDGATVLRTIETDMPVCDYAQTDELADFGSLQANLSIRVRQLGRSVPEGLPAETTVTL